MKLELITQFTNLKKSIKNKKLYYEVSDRVSPRQINGLIPELTELTLRLEEEKKRSKRRRDEKKKQKENATPLELPIYILVQNDYKNIYEMTVIEIKAYLKSKKVNNSGNKQELINKIKTVSLINKIT